MLGVDPLAHPERLRGRVGCQLQESHLPDRMRVWEALDLFAAAAPRPSTGPTCSRPGASPSKARRRLRQPVRRPAPAAAGGAGPRHRPGGRLSRRDDDRPRPGGAPHDVGAHRGDPRTRDDRRPGHALHGRGGTPLRPHRRHGCGADRRRWTRRAALVEAERRRGTGAVHPARGCGRRPATPDDFDWLAGVPHVRSGASAAAALSRCTGDGPVLAHVAAALLARGLEPCGPARRTPHARGHLPQADRARAGVRR